jgi:hypothetical protein
VKIALDAAKGDTRRQLELAGQFLQEKSLSVVEKLRAATFILNLAMRPLRSRPKAPAFRVVRATPEEGAAQRVQSQRP